jgi:hypothetical protein
MQTFQIILKDLDSIKGTSVVYRFIANLKNKNCVNKKAPTNSKN